ncbi:hypothetical protein ACYZT2_19770 [Pseudomonas sp. MDT1-85]
MSYFDEELEKELSELNVDYKKLEKEKHDSFVFEINKKVQFSGSKISWSSLKNSISYDKDEHSIKLIAEKIKSLNEIEIIFIGDSLIDNAYQVNTENLERTLNVFSEVPQHTYFFSNSLNWIGCINAEGYIDFGEILKEEGQIYFLSVHED